MEENKNGGMLQALLFGGGSGGGGSGGSGIFWVEASGTSDGSNDNTFEKASHTAAEIIDAYNQFEFPILRVSMAILGGETVITVCTFAAARSSNGQPIAVFAVGTSQLVVDHQGEVIPG